MLRAPAVDHFLELLVGDVTIFKELVIVFLREFPVVAFDESGTLVARDLTVAYLVRSIRRSPSDAEFHEAEIVVIPIDAIVEACVLRVSTFRTIRIWLKSGMFTAVIIVLLRVPVFVVTKKVYLGLIGKNLLVAGRHERLEIGEADPVLGPEFGWQTGEIMLVMIRDVARRAKGVFQVAAVLDLTVLAVHHERDVVLHRHVEGEVRLAVYEGLKRIAEVLRCQPSQAAGDDPVRGAEDVVES